MEEHSKQPDRVFTTFVGPLDTTIEEKLLSCHQPELGHSTPHQLTRSPREQWPQILGDVCLIGAPLALISKIILVFVAHSLDKPDNTAYDIDNISSITRYLIEFNLQLTTLFTVLFAAVISACVRRVALWRAQKGAEIMELEQWQASITIADTLKTFLGLRFRNKMVALQLLMVWVWYYLGSQACAREYGYRDSDPVGRYKVTVSNVEGPSSLDNDLFARLNNSARARANSQFITAISDDVSTANGYSQHPYDQDGRWLVPYTRGLLEHPDRKGWYKVDAGNFAAASRMGPNTYGWFDVLEFPLWLNQLVGTLDFRTSYLDVECTASQIMTVSSFPSGVLPSVSVSLNWTTPDNSSSEVAPPTFDIWIRTSKGLAADAVLKSVCTMTMQPLQVQAACSSQGCKIKKLKYLDKTQDAQSLIKFSDSAYTTRFFNEMLLSSGVPSTLDDPSVVESAVIITVPIELGNGTTVELSDAEILNSIQLGSIQTTAAAYDLALYDASFELQQGLLDLSFQRSYNITNMINTYLTVYQQLGASQSLEADCVVRSGNHSENQSSNESGVYQGLIQCPWLSQATLQGSFFWPQYMLSIPWIIVDIISCSLLLAAGVLTICLRHYTLVPDVLGYVSSLTRDNPHFHPIELASTLSGLERARELKGVKVRFQDVQPDDPVGQISLVPVCMDAQSKSGKVKLSKNRSYL